MNEYTYIDKNADRTTRVGLKPVFWCEAPSAERADELYEEELGIHPSKQLHIQRIVKACEAD